MTPLQPATKEAEPEPLTITVENAGPRKLIRTLVYLALAIVCTTSMYAVHQADTYVDMFGVHPLVDCDRLGLELTSYSVRYCTSPRPAHIVLTRLEASRPELYIKDHELRTLRIFAANCLAGRQQECSLLASVPATGDTKQFTLTLSESLALHAVYNTATDSLSACHWKNSVKLFDCNDLSGIISMTV